MCEKSIFFGSKAVWLGKKADRSRTHFWRIYVRSITPVGCNLEDIIEKVEFRLHESIVPSVVVVSNPPFSVENYGWGEFDALIRVYFKNHKEGFVDMVQHLQLFVADEDGNQVFSRAPVIYNNIVRVVFTDKDPDWLQKLKVYGKQKIDKPKTTNTDNYNQISELIDYDQERGKMI